MRSYAVTFAALVAAASAAEQAQVGCAAGTYFWGTFQNKHYCVKCPAGTTSAGCTNCEKDPFHATCKVADAMPAKKCAPGSRIDKASKSGCTPCTAGRWNGAWDSGTCHDCPKGHFMPNPGMHACYKCNKGFYASATRSSKCTKCATCNAGKFAFTKSMGSSSADACSCLDCARGKYTAKGQHRCWDCPAGRSQGSVGMAGCNICAKGQFQAGKGAATCFKCPEGYTTEDEGATSKAQCSKPLKKALSCKAGTYIFYKAATKSLYCLNCPRGQYGFIKAGWQYGGDCDKCDAGSYMPYEGKTSCFKCGKGLVADATGTACTTPTTTTAAPATTTTTTSAPATTKAPSHNDCVVSAWKPTTVCAKSCGSKQTAIWERTVLRQPAPGGVACPMLMLTKPCNAEPCPRHCTVTQWGAYGACDATCGDGQKTRTRTIFREAINGGSCPPLSESAPCSVSTECPIDCTVTDWLSWGACSKTCGDGVQKRFRKVQAPANDKGKACPSLSQTRSCAGYPCPVDCVQGDWSDFSPCSKTCGAGLQKRSRKVLRKPAFGGKRCGTFNEERACVSACPVDCVMAAWGAWGACTRSCGTGTQERKRNIITRPRHGGEPCGRYTQQQQCESTRCPVDCVMDPWSEFTPCSATCGFGTQTKTRGIARQAQAGGKQCAHQQVTKRCHVRHCPVHCKYSQWSPLSKCSVSCGSDGTQSQTRTIIESARNGGKACSGSLVDTQTCNMGPCPVHCEVGKWGSWGACSKTCFNGQHNSPSAPVQFRTRTVTSKAQHGGAKCPLLRESRGCNHNILCKINCKVGTWGGWGQCSNSCGGGIARRSREIVQEQENGGRSCSALWQTKTCNAVQCPVDCHYGRWTAWGACSKDCGGGFATKSRGIDIEAAYGGKKCDTNSLTATKSCNLQGCPVDCVMSKWSKATTCTATCGSGIQYQKRRVVRPNRHGGKACGAIEHISACNVAACPVDCEVGSFGAWSTCTKNCGIGWQSRTRPVTRYREHGGRPCPDRMEGRYCNKQPCPTDCLLGMWSEWSQCDKSCGDGLRHATRNIAIHDSNGGAECPAATSAERTRTMKCNLGVCPRACVMTKWGTWSTCSTDRANKCGVGSTQRARTVHRLGIQSACPHTEEKKPCNLKPCPQDCVLSPLSAFGGCSASCGGGRKTASRRVISPARFGGKICKPLIISKSCKSFECPIDTVFSEWSKWSTCNVPCGGGVQSRDRSRNVEAAFGGVDGVTEESRPCNTQMCAVDCVMGSWGGWSKCAVSCGGGNKMRFRGITTAAQNGGKCPYTTSESMVCGENACPVDCVVGSWSAMGSCSKTCGVGTRSRERLVLVMPKHGGKACPGKLVKTDDWRGITVKGNSGWRNVQRYVCDAGPCPVHCEVSAYSQWGSCSKSCGGGKRTRTRTITKEERNGGSRCPRLVDEESCNSKGCPVDCKMNAWSSWTPCDLPCGGGKQRRERTVRTPVQNGGRACGSMTAIQSCNTHVCPVDCKLTKWGVWFPASGCSKPCGGGTKYRTKAILAEAQGSGKACIEFTRKQTVPCNQQPCDVDCVMTEWSTWGSCSADCGTGTRSRVRSVQVPPMAGGKACGARWEEGKCNVQKCPIDCVPNPWGRWDACSVSCGRGTSSMTRGIKVQPAFGGKTCQELRIPLTVTRPCHIKPCPVHCELSDWSEWSTCSVSCGTGFRAKTRDVITLDSWGGKPCTGRKLKDTEQCDLGICPVNCVVSQWGAFSPCTSDGSATGTVKTCGGGLRKRTRTVTTQVKHTKLGLGKVCPKVEEVIDCAHKICPTDCKMSKWSEWSTCDAKCGGGFQFRKRSVETPASHNGKSCPSSHEKQRCNTQVCDIDCEYSAWSAMSSCSKFCGGGERYATRSVVTPSQGNGKYCDYGSGLKKTEACNTDVCLSDRVRCASAFAESAATATKLGNGCFAAIKAALVSGVTSQGSSTGSCLWKFYTTMDIRERCPKRVATAAEIAADYPTCEKRILAQCAKSVDCRATHGVEIAQGKVWNADKSSNRSCPPPTEYSFALDKAFVERVPKNVDINLASAKKLDKLFGIGPLYASRIVNYRNKNGAFTSVQGLASVKGISKGAVERMFENVSSKYYKPIVSGKTAAGDFCTFGEQVVIDWWQAKSVAVNVDDSSGATLGAAKQGTLAGVYNFGKDGPWQVKFDVHNSGKHGDVTDTLDATLDGATTTLQNVKTETISQSVTNSKFEYRFAFDSSSAAYNEHMHIENAVATCTAEPKNCVPAQWGAWGKCSRDCNMDNKGSGIQRRTRGIAKHAQYGGKCDESLSQVRRCNNQACPWQAVVEAEDGRLAGCSAFDNEVYTSESNPRTNFKGAGYVAMDAGALKDKSCREKPSTITWQVRVPTHGRYQLKFRYAVDNGKAHTAKVSTAMASEQVVVNYQYEENIGLQGKPGDDFSTWRDAYRQVDLYKGVNTITVTTSPHKTDGSKPHIDRMTVKKLTDLKRCVPGSTVPLKWFASATPSSKSITGTAGGAKLGAGFDGTLRGYADLGALGPWSVQFKTKGGHPNDSARVMFNSVNVGNSAGGSEHAMSIPVQSASISYKMDFTAMNAAAGGHMEVLDGFAVCEGCSDVSCKRVQVGKHFKIIVSHPHGARSDDGNTLGNGELHGNNHLCKYNSAWETCQCTCDTKPLNHGPTKCPANTYRKTSSYVQQDGTTKSVTRCVACPYGYESKENSSSCTGIPKFVWSQDNHIIDGKTVSMASTRMAKGGAIDTMSNPFH